MSTYRHRVRFERPVRVRNSGNGNIEDTWVPVFDFNVPVAIITLSGRELLAAQQIHAQVDTRIEMRFQSEITAELRAINPYDNNRAYNVRAVLPDNTRRRYINLLCESGTDAGG